MQPVLMPLPILRFHMDNRMSKSYFILKNARVYMLLFKYIRCFQGKFVPLHPKMVYYNHHYSYTTTKYKIYNN